VTKGRAGYDQALFDLGSLTGIDTVALRQSPNRSQRRAGHLLRHHRTGSLNCGDRRRRLIDQRFNNDGRNAGMLHVKRVGRARREVDDASAGVRTAVVDFDDD